MDGEKGGETMAKIKKQRMTVKIESLVRYGARGWMVEVSYPIANLKDHIRTNEEGKGIWTKINGKWIQQIEPSKITIPKEKKYATVAFLNILGARPIHDTSCSG